MDEERLTLIEESLDDLPKEVKDFVFGAPMEQVKDELSKITGSEDPALAVYNALMFYLIGGKTLKELDDTITALPLADEAKKAIATLIQEKVIDELLLLIEVHQEMDGEAAAASTATAPSPADVIASMQSRLMQAKVVAPITRERPIEKPAATESGAPASVSADPYREIPEK